MKRRKVFIGPCEIAGYYANLAKGLKALGVDCDYITYAPHPFGYEGESPTPAVLKLMRFFVRCQAKFAHLFLLRVLFSRLAELCRVVWGGYAIFKYDCFVFGFGNSLFRGNGDLWLIKLLGKKIIANLGHGSEARPPYIDGSYQTPDGAALCSVGEINNICRDKYKRVARVQQYADIVIGAPFSNSQFMHRPFVNFLSIGIPLSYPDATLPAAQQQAPAGEGAEVVRILHSPSHPALKGTDTIVKAVESLVAKGHRIELILIHGRPHREVMAAIQHCDFVVDQLYSDTPMAGFASEAAWYGKPAIVGGYGFDCLRAFLPESEWPPSHLCAPEDVERAIEYLVVNRAERIALGHAARAFVRKNWNASVVAQGFVKLLDGAVPDHWWLRPESIVYLQGVGLKEERVKENVRQLVHAHGVQSLRLQHNPVLQRAFLEFAGIEVERP